MYGWPRDYLREEQAADLKLVADALFANGINDMVWHGKAHIPKDSAGRGIYTVYIGEGSKLTPEIRPFNAYLEKVSSYMRKGVTYSDVAVYLPTEDAWTAGILPKEKRLRWSWGYYEMRYVYFPDELAGYNPTWINGEFLQKAEVKNGVMNVGGAACKALYIDVAYLDFNVLKRVVELAESGLTIILKQVPKEPGTLLHSDYASLIEKLNTLKTSAIPKSLPPFIEGNTIPNHWCRKEGETLYIFFPQPNANRLKFPIEYGQSLETATKTMDVSINYQGQRHNLSLSFAPYQSLLYAVSNGKIEQISIEFIPLTPEVRQRPADFKAPWLANE